MLSDAFALEFFELVPWGKPQILRGYGGIECREHRPRPFDQISRETLALSACHRIGGAFASGADDHGVSYRLAIRIAIDGRARELAEPEFGSS